MIASESDPTNESLESLRLLVVDDGMMIVMLIEDSWKKSGSTIVRPVATVADALQLITSEAIDGAMLDMNLAGGAVYPVAGELAHRGVPFIFISGDGDGQLRSDFADRPKLPKPLCRQHSRRPCRVLDRLRSSALPTLPTCTSFAFEDDCFEYTNGGALEHAQEMAGHESPRRPKLYDRTKEWLTQDEVGQIRRLQAEHSR